MLSTAILITFMWKVLKVTDTSSENVVVTTEMKSSFPAAVHLHVTPHINSPLDMEQPETQKSVCDLSVNVKSLTYNRLEREQNHIITFSSFYHILCLLNCDQGNIYTVHNCLLGVFFVLPDVINFSVKQIYKY